MAWAQLSEGRDSWRAILGARFQRVSGIAAVCALVLLVSALPARAQLPSAVGWTALPASTSLEGSGQCPPNGFGGDPYPFATNCQNVIRTWNGAIADTTANRLIIWGGGHDNYFGNEIYTLNLTANPITLTRAKDPTVPTNYANAANCVEGIPPGNATAPNSREDYGGLAFLPGPYRMMILDGSLACINGDGSNDTWTIPLSGLSNSSAWVDEGQTLSGTRPNNDGNGPYGNVAAYDPNSGLVFVSDSEAIYTYNYSTNTYNRITSAKGFTTGIYLSGAIDPTRKLFVLVGACGNGTCASGNGVFVADISDPTTTTQQDWTTNTMADPNCAEFLQGGANPINASNPGITFDSVADDFVGWPNEGNNVYTLTPDVANQRLTCTKVTFANGPPNSSHANNTPNTSYGTFGRFQYFPALDVFVLVNDWNIPAYILRLRSASDFSMSATPSSATVVQGGSTSYTVSTEAIGSFSGTIDLSVSGLPSGATASFSSSAISAGASATLTVDTTSSTPIGSYTLTITGTSGSLTHTATVTIGVTGTPSFTLSASPGSQSVTAGNEISYTVTVNPVNGFGGTVDLSISGLPSDATGTFTPSAVAAGDSATLTITTTASTPSGSYTLKISGTSGSLGSSVSVTLSVSGAPGFTLSASPGSASVTAGNSASYTVTVTSVNGFSGTVSLSVSGLPSGATGTFTPAAVAAGASATLSITTGTSTPAGTYSLTIGGSGDGISTSTGVTLIVTAASSGGKITFVQAAFAAPQGPANPVSVMFSLAQTAGNLNVVFVGWNDTTATISSVTDMAGNTYALASGPTKNGTISTQAMYYAKNISGGLNAVTVTFDVAASYPDVRILEYAGASTTNPLDVAAGAAGTNTMAAVSLATSNADDLIVAGDYIQSVTPSAGSGFTERILSQPDSDIVEDESVTATGTHEATAPLGTSGWWVMNAAAFRAASAAPPPPAAVAFVQVAYSVPQADVASVAATFADAQSGGDLNIVIVGWNDTTATVKSVTDAKGNTYTLAAGPTLMSGIATQAIYYAKDIVGAAAGANTVTVEFNGSATFPDLRILEYSGASTSDPIDGTGGASGTGTTASATLSAATTNADDLILGGDFIQNVTTAGGAGFTTRVITQPDSDIVEDEMVSATGIYTASASIGSGWWVMQVVAIR